MGTKNIMWPIGFSWTKTHNEEIINPDGTREVMRVQGEPFYFNRFWGMEFYIGFRPTATWGAGYGNEGDLGMGWWGRLKKNLGIGNLGCAFRKEQ